MKALRLHLCGEYFDAIKAGTKTHEFRAAEIWERRLAGKDFSCVLLFRGYPCASDMGRVMRRPWRGYTVETITHPHFGAKPVRVLAIDVRP